MTIYSVCSNVTYGCYHTKTDASDDRSPYKPVFDKEKCQKWTNQQLSKQQSRELK